MLHCLASRIWIPTVVRFKLPALTHASRQMPVYQIGDGFKIHAYTHAHLLPLLSLRWWPEWAFAMSIQFDVGQTAKFWTKVSGQILTWFWYGLQIFLIPESSYWLWPLNGYLTGRVLDIRIWVTSHVALFSTMNLNTVINESGSWKFANSSIQYCIQGRDW